MSNTSNIGNISNVNDISDLVKEGYDLKEAKDLYKEVQEEVYQENKNLMRFATYADKWAKNLAPISATIDTATLGGILGVVPVMAMDFIKKVPKLSFLAYYGARSHDVVGVLGDLLYEAGSTIPLAGELLDFHERYTSKTETYLQKETSRRIKERLKQEETGLKKAA